MKFYIAADRESGLRSTTYDITIIGGGPVGLYAGALAGEMGAQCNILESRCQMGGIMMSAYPDKNVYNFPGFPAIRGRELIQDLVNRVKAFGVDTPPSPVGHSREVLIGKDSTPARRLRPPRFFLPAAAAPEARYSLAHRASGGYRFGRTLERQWRGIESQTYNRGTRPALKHSRSACPERSRRGALAYAEMRVQKLRKKDLWAPAPSPGLPSNKEKSWLRRAPSPAADYQPAWSIMKSQLLARDHALLP